MQKFPILRRQSLWIAPNIVCILRRRTSINDVSRFLAVFNLPSTYLPTLSYSIESDFWEYLGPSLPNLIFDIINGRSLALLDVGL